MALPLELQKAQHSLQDGQYRFADASANLKYSWFPSHLQPQMGDELLSNYGVDSGVDWLQEQFREEIEQIEKAFGFEEALPKELKGWQSKGAKGTVALFEYKIDRQATILSIWDTYSVPVRYKNGRVYRIWSPKDIMGEPIIKHLSVEDFIRLACVETAAEYAAFAKLNKQLQVWQAVAGVIAFLLICALAYIYR
jgi:hypothetical protein